MSKLTELIKKIALKPFPGKTKKGDANAKPPVPIPPKPPTSTEDK